MTVITKRQRADGHATIFLASRTTTARQRGRASMAIKKMKNCRASVSKLSINNEYSHNELNYNFLKHKSWSFCRENRLRVPSSARSPNVGHVV